MSIPVLVLGASGSGKSTSLRNLDPEECFLIQPINKILPFRHANAWKVYDKETKQGSIFNTDDYDAICTVIKKAQKDIIIIDDFQSVILNEYMRKALVTGYTKFTENALHVKNVIDAITSVNNSKRVYLFCHPSLDEMGNINIKAPGKMIAEKVNIPGDVSICLMTHIDMDKAPGQGRYGFMTQVFLGNDPTKSPLGMFEEQRIDNDLKFVDDAILAYFKM